MSRYYDLFVLLDPEAPEERRAAIVERVKSQIDSGGASLKGDADWGMRRLSYEIDHRREAQYHLFQFEGTPEVLRQLHRALSIDDSVLRHRIIRVPAVPETTPSAPEEAPRRTGEDRGGPRDARERRDREFVPDGDEDEVSAPPPPAPEAPVEAASVPPPAPAEPASVPPPGPAEPTQLPDDAAETTS